jgi:hypothetical protein
MFVYCGCKDSENIADKQIIYQKTPIFLRMSKIKNIHLQQTQTER